MIGLTTDLLGSACRIFLSLAYPAGEESIPAQRRIYLALPPGRELAAYHAEHPLPAASFQVLSDGNSHARGYAIRLGCTHFPHLKLRVQCLVDQDGERWVFFVDTHDAYSQESACPPPDHPDAEKWADLRRANAELKERIERAWEEADLLTFNAVLRQDLDRAPADHI